MTSFFLAIINLTNLLAFFLICALILYVIFFIKYNNLKTTFLINFEEMQKLREELQFLSDERIEHIRRIEQLSTSLKIQEESKEESLKNSKAVLYDLSNSVVNQLLELHKKETTEARKQSEEKIARSTEQYNQELQKIASLVGVLTKDMETSKALVDNLKSALLSPSATGALAEITLENLLKNSGLSPDVDFILQYSFSGVDKNKLRPDAIVFLPDDNVLIIDAKSSQFLVSEENDIELAKSMQLHLKNLASKDYISELRESYEKKNVKFKRISLLMFMPTEQAIDRISKIDRNFIQKAWQHNIYPVGPSGLMNVLSIARMHISEKLRIDNYEQIIQEINSLLNSIGIISEHGARLGSNIVSLINNYDKFAASFNRNLVSKAKNLKVLGTGQQAKQSKMLERCQLISPKNDLIEAEPVENEEPALELKNID